MYWAVAQRGVSSSALDMERSNFLRSGAQALWNCDMSGERSGSGIPEVEDAELLGCVEADARSVVVAEMAGDAERRESYVLVLRIVVHVCCGQGPSLRVEGFAGLLALLPAPPAAPPGGLLDLPCPLLPVVRVSPRLHRHVHAPSRVRCVQGRPRRA